MGTGGSSEIDDVKHDDEGGHTGMELGRLGKVIEELSFKPYGDRTKKLIRQRREMYREGGVEIFL